MTQSWRPDIDAQTYFGQQKRVAEIEKRRPNLRRAADLVGPGINAGAVRVTNWNDTLAQFNGYFSSLPGAANAPNLIESFVGIVLQDSELGGRQVLTGLSSRVQYTRVFVRNPSDPTNILWDAAWAPALTSQTVEAYIKTQFNKADQTLDLDGNVSGSSLLSVRMGSVYLTGTISFGGTEETTASNPARRIGKLPSSDDAPSGAAQFSVPLSGAGANGKPGMLAIATNGEVTCTVSFPATAVRLGGSWAHKTLGK